MKNDRFGAFTDISDDAGCGTGPLGGLRVAVKDNIAVAGLGWSAGLPLLADRKAARDAPCVSALRAAGAAIIGTTVTDAAGFGMLTPGVVNPIAAGYSAGGSSGGSAAAVAGGLADLALGTDTGGSVRVPAACCGIYGLKPTYGRISLDHVTPLSFTFDQVGLMARDLAVLERGAASLLPAASKDAGPVRRLGFDPARLAQAHPAVRAAIEPLLSRLPDDGYELMEVELPDPVHVSEVHGMIVCAEALEIWREYWPSHSNRFAEQARTGLAYAATLGVEAISEARSALPAIRQLIGRCFDQVDAIVGPTIAVPPPKAGARSARYFDAEVPIVFALLAEACTFNVSGHPALTVPLRVPVEGGIPFALQIAVRHDEEATAFALARQLADTGVTA